MKGPGIRMIIYGFFSSVFRKGRNWYNTAKCFRKGRKWFNTANEETGTMQQRKK